MTVRDIFVNAEQESEAAELARFYPEQFPRPVVAEWPPGWTWLIRRVCRLVDEERADVRWRRIQEIGGALQMRWHAQPLRLRFTTLTGHAEVVLGAPLFSEADIVESIVSDADRDSRRTCASCGEAGSTRARGRHLIALCGFCGGFLGYLAIDISRDAE